MDPDDLVNITVTGPNIDMMADLVRGLVEARLVAGGDILPGVRSIYTGNGKVQDDNEVLAILHTRRGVVDKVMTRVADEHPDETPQIIVLPVAEAIAGYHDWVLDATK